MAYFERVGREKRQDGEEVREATGKCGIGFKII